MWHGGVRIFSRLAGASPRAPACRGRSLRPNPLILRRKSLAGEADHAADHLTLVHQLEGLVDALERERAADHLVEFDAAGQVAVDEARELRAALRPAKCRAAPRASGHQEKRTCVDLLPCS